MEAVSIAPQRLNFSEAARRLGVASRSIPGLIEAGALKSVTLPGMRPTILASSVDELIRRMNGDDRQAG